MNLPIYILAGNMVRFFFAFTDIAGAAADPTTVAVKVGTGMADEVALSPVRDALGEWHADWDTTGASEAIYYCECIGVGNLVVAAEVAVKIRSPHL